MATLFLKPQPVSELKDRPYNSCELVSQLIPSYDQIPDQYKVWHSPWSTWASTWFFCGLEYKPVPKEGIDLDEALDHLQVIQRCTSISHEHKEAAVAYLASLWFLSDGHPKL